MTRSCVSSPQVPCLAYERVRARSSVHRSAAASDNWIVNAGALLE